MQSWPETVKRGLTSLQQRGHSKVWVIVNAYIQQNIFHLIVRVYTIFWQGFPLTSFWQTYCTELIAWFNLVVVKILNFTIKYAAQRMTRGESHIDIHAVVQKFVVHPKKWTIYDSKLIVDALYDWLPPHPKKVCMSNWWVSQLPLCVTAACTSIFMNQIEIYAGFMKSDALQVAKRAELRTVDAKKQTVLRQGFVYLDFLSTHFLTV